jgi:hypothetical protein
MPVLWFEEHVVADESVGALVRIILLMPLVGEILGIILVLLAIILMAVPFIKRHHKELQENDLKPVELIQISPENLPLMKN